jgi:hypothetical protein
MAVLTPIMKRARPSPRKLFKLRKLVSGITRPLASICVDSSLSTTLTGIKNLDACSRG